MSERDGQDDKHVSTMVTTYMMKKRAKSGFWSSGREESPRRMNSETLLVWLTLSMVPELIHIPIYIKKYILIQQISTHSSLFPRFYKSP